MKKCKKIYISFKFKNTFIVLYFNKDDYGVSDLENTNGDKIFPKFPYVCIDDDEPLSDEILDKLKLRIENLLATNRQFFIDNDIIRHLINQIMTTVNRLPSEEIIPFINVNFEEADASKCGDDCEPVDDEEDPELPPLVPEDEENIFESLDDQCYSGSVEITYTLNGETTTETYTFYYTGDGENVPASPNLETIQNYFNNYRGTNLPPDWLDITGVAITEVKPSLMGGKFWNEVDNGCNNEPPSEPEPDDPVPAPEPSPPPSPPPAPQPKPDKVINVELNGCDGNITANIGLYNKIIENIMVNIYKEIVRLVFSNRDTLRKFAPNSNPLSKLNKDSLIWIGKKQNSSMPNDSSAGILIKDDRWGVLINSLENTLNLPVGFRFNASFDLILGFTANLSVKCGEDTKTIPISFGHSFDSSIIVKNSANNTKIVTFNKVPGKNIYALAPPTNLETILKDVLRSATLDINSDIIENKNGLQYKAKIGDKIANILKSIVTETLQESKKISECDCCLVSISDIKIDRVLFDMKDITTPGGDSILRPDLRNGGAKK